MKQKQLLKPLFLLCALLVGGLNSLWAADETITFSEQGYSNQQAIETVSGTNFTITFDKGSNSNAPKYYTSGTAIRAYGGNTFTVSSDTKTIEKIEITFGSSDGSNAITTDVDTYKDGTWTGSSNSVTFTIGGTSGNRRLASIAVTYASSSTTNACATPTFNPEAGAYTSAQNVTINTTTDGATIYYTTNGTDPTTNSNAYTAAIPVSTTTTIKAIAVKDGMDNSSVATATYTIVSIEHAGTEADPYTVADAIAAIDVNEGITEVYVTGIVCEGGSNLNNGAMNYWISDDGTETNKFEIYKGKGIDGADFTSVNDIKIGDVVVVKGDLTKYNTTYEFSNGSQLVSLQREKGPAVINVSDKEVAYGETYTLSRNDIEGGDVTVNSSNEAVATVDGLVITPVAVGTTTITVETDENEYYNAGSATFTLTVTAPEGSAAAPSGDALFNETFDQLEGTGGRDNTYTGNIGTSSTTGKLDENWTTIGENGANKCIKLGTGSAAGTVTTGNIALKGNGTLTFSAAGWGDTKTNTITVSATGAELDGVTEWTLEASTWNSYTVNITDATGEVAITFTMKRGFLDDVKVVAEGSLPTAPTVTLAASGYASYCCEYPLDLDQLDNDNVKAYIVTDVNGEDVTFTQLTGKIKGGVPFILYGTPNFECQLTYTESDVVPSGNMLVGTLAPTYVTVGNIYGLSGGQFKKINTGVMKANKAYLATTSSAPALNIIFDEDGTTGIRSIDNGQLTIDNVYYDLSGRRIEKPTKGLYIVNGKKVILK